MQLAQSSRTMIGVVRIVHLECDFCNQLRSNVSVCLFGENFTSPVLL